MNIKAGEKRVKKQSKTAADSKKILVMFIFLTVIFLFAPNLDDTPTFAATYFDSPEISSQNFLESTIDYDAPAISDSTRTLEKSRAPEFSSLFLLLSGITGLFVRFIRRSFQRLKRLTDILLASTGLVFCFPFLLVSAIFIKLTSKGPIIYRQERLGKFGEIFRIYKLRTMCVDAEKNTGAIWAAKNDSRVTLVGKILRRLHVDEIPQLLNVLKGEMSIVGPRPERPELVRDLKTLIKDYESRLVVKPGITGLAQVWHKYDETIEDVKKKVKYDLLYIRKMCLMVDLRILAQTVVAVLLGRGAN